MKEPGDDWGILLVASILAILLPWWVFVLLPFVPCFSCCWSVVSFGGSEAGGRDEIA